MADIILHHYPLSPYAEKVRTALGIKNAAWRGVIIPVIMPKPDLMPLTGGYRKTPVMQIGADVYCDTQLILRALERRIPEPTLYPGGSGGLADGIAWWAERSLFNVAVGVAFAKTGGQLPPGFAEDRAKFSGREVNLERIRAAEPRLLADYRAQLQWLEETLAKRPFLLGERPRRPIARSITWSGSCAVPGRNCSRPFPRSRPGPTASKPSVTARRRRPMPRKRWPSPRRRRPPRLRR